MRKRSPSPPQTVAESISWAETRLTRAKLHFGHGTDNARDEAAWLVGSTLGISPYELDEHLGDRLSDGQRDAVIEIVKRRIDTKKPAAYLLNEAWFAGLKFYVDERVIVPRSITGEYILEQFQPWIDATRVKRLLDLCTGSGCMAIACAHAFPDAHIDAADISEDALAVARINVERHNVADRVRLVQSDLFGALAGERYDVIVTNPPYVGADEMRTLPAEYRHEPRLALASGIDGLDAIIGILAEAADHLADGGILVAEVGNSNEVLQRAFPDVPFLWLTDSLGDDSVFLLTQAQLTALQQRFFSARDARRSPQS